MAQKAPRDALKEAQQLENRTRLQNQSQKLGATRTKNTRYAAGMVKVDLIRASLAEISFHWSQLDPLPTKAVVVHSLNVIAHRTLKLLRVNLGGLGIPESTFGTSKLSHTQEIGAAVEFLGCDGLIAPSARWPCDNLILFPDRMSFDAVLEIHSSEPVDCIQWAIEHGIVKTGS